MSKLSKVQISILEMMEGLWYLIERPDGRFLKSSLSGHCLKVRNSTFTALLEGGYIDYRGKDVELTGKPWRAG